ncbi:MerR family transcriptional regulator [Leisingera aquaemixtae]|uniref:MerR family transcriptional regulator n=1 Tax=Leisingera aquaemixtae TaxID=1396826 RepID=UPI0021A88597|nr:MerR family transcriptional regulator [Leisingera aquaemixtae]
MSKSPDAFRTISEVADWLGVQAHVLRFWESKFTQVKPVKRAGGRRYYRPADMRLLGGIKKLLHDDGMSIKDVQVLLREHGPAHVAEFSHPVDGAAAERSAPVPPADRLGDDWQSSLELSHEQAAEEDTGSEASNVVGFPQQDAAADDILQDPADAPAAVSPAAPADVPETEETAADTADPAAAPEPQMRMDLAAPAAETGAVDETGAAAESEPGPSAPSPLEAQDPAADGTAPPPAEATETPHAPAVESDTASPWSEAAAEDSAEETTATAAAPADSAPLDPAPEEMQDPQDGDDSAGWEAGTEPAAAPPAAAEAQPDAPDGFGTPAESGSAETLPDEPPLTAAEPPVLEDTSAAETLWADAQEPADSAQPADPAPKAAPDFPADSDTADLPEQFAAQETAEDAASPAAADPLAAPIPEPDPSVDTLAAAAGVQPEEPLDFGSGAEPFAAAMEADPGADDADATADPAAAFPPHDLDRAARQVDALEFGSGFDPDADAAAEPDQPQDSPAAAPAAETEDAAELESAADAPAPVLPHPGVLSHLAAVRSLPPQTVAAIAACAEDLRALAARGAVARAPVSGAGSGPDLP